MTEVDLDPIWMSHMEFLDRHMKDADYAAKIKALQRANGMTVPEHCTGQLRLTDRAGRMWSACCDGCRFEIGVARETLDRTYSVADLLVRSKLPPLRDREFEHTPGSEAARAACRAFIEQYQEPTRPRPPALVGQSGRGKTHLLAVTGRLLIERYLADVLYMTASELVDAAGEAMKGDRFGRWARATYVTVLVLDDLGAQRATDFAVDRVQSLVDTRYREGRPTLVASNLDPDEWPTVFGSRVASRLVGMTDPVEVTGDDWRQRRDTTPPQEVSP